MSGQAGFSLIEMLLSVAILTLLVGLSLPVYISFAQRNDLDLTTQSVAAALRRAETYSRGVNGDSGWGVELQSTGVTLFKGNSFASRTTAYDETIALPGSVTLGGTSEVLFARLSGAPAAAGSITLTSTTNDTRTITVNAKGMVNY